MGLNLKILRLIIHKRPLWNSSDFDLWSLIVGECSWDFRKTDSSIKLASKKNIASSYFSSEFGWRKPYITMYTSPTIIVVISAIQILHEKGRYRTVIAAIWPGFRCWEFSPLSGVKWYFLHFFIFPLTIKQIWRNWFAHHTAPEGDPGLIWVPIRNSTCPRIFNENAFRKCKK